MIYCKHIIILLTLLLCLSFAATAQKKKKTTPSPPDLTERTPYAPPKKDTIPIVYENIPARKPKEQEVVKPNFKEKATIITPKPGIEPPRKNLPIIYDTVKLAKKPKEGDEQYNALKRRDTLVATTVTDKQKADSTVSKQEGNCQCVAITIKAQETIKFEDYINYSFSVVNNCKGDVFVHSGSFRFVVADYFGKPVKRLRKLDFIKRFDHPEFVRLSPGEVYEYRFADDPFFEYELSRGSQYRFSFSYRNNANPYKAAPAKTVMCAETKEVVVTVQ